MDGSRFDQFAKNLVTRADRRRLLAGLLGAALAESLGRATVTAKGSGNTITLTGAAEVPGPGDPDGTGTATIRLNSGRQRVCWELQVSNITLPATGAHIHVGTPTEAGPVVVALTPPDATGHSSGCTSASRDLIKAIRRNPENYYVNVHTVDFPDGAIRGQLG